MSDPARIAEDRDLIAYLGRSDFAPLLEAAADPSCLRNGRLSGTAAARKTRINRRKIWALMRLARDQMSDSNSTGFLAIAG